LYCCTLCWSAHLTPCLGSVCLRCWWLGFCCAECACLCCWCAVVFVGAFLHDFSVSHGFCVWRLSRLCYAHVCVGRPVLLACMGRAPKKAPRLSSTSPAVRPTSILALADGTCVQCTHMMSPLSSIPTGYFLAIKYTRVLLAFVYGDRWTWALTWERQFLIAISSALRAT
jgi:hypothetical protein